MSAILFFPNTTPQGSCGGCSSLHIKPSAGQAIKLALLAYQAYNIFTGKPSHCIESDSNQMKLETINIREALSHEKNIKRRT
jgi:hypothetical protein